MTRISQYRKFLVALITAFSILASTTLLPITVRQWLTVLISFAGAYGVYRVPNDIYTRL